MQLYIFQVQSAEKAILNIKDYTLAVSQYAQAALRDVIGGIELDPLLSRGSKFQKKFKKLLYRLLNLGGFWLLILRFKI